MKTSLAVRRADKIFIRNISKGHNFTKIVGGVTVLVLCTLSDTSLFLYPVSKNILDGFFKLKSRHIFHRKIFKGALFRKNVDGITIIFSAHCVMVVYICTKFQENFLDSIKVIERTQFSEEKISKEHNSVKNVDEVTALFL